MDITNNKLTSSAAFEKASEDFLVSKTATSTPVNDKAAETAPSASTLQEVGGEQLEEAVSRISDYVQNQQRTLQFSVDEGSGRNVVTVLDKQTEEVIRQIPQEEILVIARRLEDSMDDKVNLFSLLV
jgi:flagellar protein FlaG